jgi:hypothetical protein
VNVVQSDISRAGVAQGFVSKVDVVQGLFDELVTNNDPAAIQLSSCRQAVTSTAQHSGAHAQGRRSTSWSPTREPEPPGADHAPAPDGERSDEEDHDERDDHDDDGEDSASGVMHRARQIYIL